MANTSRTAFDPSQPLETEGYVCNSRGEELKLQKVVLPPLLETQVQVNIEEVGLCHTDIHMRDNDWGTTDFPIVLGHEGVGIITHIGVQVKKLKVGDRVGIAWIRDGGCLKCEYCMEGRENICEAGYQGTYLGKSAGKFGKSKLNYNEMGGCYVKIQRIQERFAILLPDSLSNQDICPLLCGGATLYEPLINHITNKNNSRTQSYNRVGIMGFGGLGRCGLKLSKLRHNYTVIISSSESKREAALQSGADEFWCLTDPEDVKQKRKDGPGLDLIIDTTPSVGANTDLNEVMSNVRNNGVYCRVGIPPASKQGFQHNWIPAIFMQQSVTGSCVTGSARLNELIELCGSNAKFIRKGNDVFDVEVIPFDQVNHAMDLLSQRKNKSYRYILRW